MTGRIVGRFLDHTGAPLQGEVELVPLVRTVTRAGMDAVYLPARQVVPLDVAGRLDLEVVAPGEGMNPSGWVWAALGAYAVAWGEYLLSQTVARSRGITAWR